MAELRVRHGITYDPLFGYRALVEVNGDRTWLGPWTTEAEAQATADTSAAAFKAATDDDGAARTTGDTPLGVWMPDTQAVRP